MKSSRSSPFRRPTSPVTVNSRSSTPPSRNGVSPMTSPSKLKQSYTVSEDEEEIFQTPTKIKPETSSFGAPDSLSRIPPQLLHSLRESFAVLDSNSTGSINPATVMESLQSLGLQENNISQFFPANQPQQMTLPNYLSQLSDLLVGLSSQQELLNAFSAYDDDDNGQIDVHELQTALLNTAPDPGERKLTENDINKAIGGFTGRRRFAGNPMPSRGGGDVFRYQEFVASITGPK